MSRPTRDNPTPNRPSRPERPSPRPAPRPDRGVQVPANTPDRPDRGDQIRRQPDSPNRRTTVDDTGNSPGGDPNES